MPVNQREKQQRERNYTKAKEVAEKQARGFEPKSWRLPKGKENFRFKEEKVYDLDILSYKAGKSNPMADAGLDHYERTFYTHTGIGLEPRDHHVCLQKTFGQACPVCDEAAARRAKGMDWDTSIQFLGPKKRQLWQWKDREEPKKGFQIYEGSYNKGFGEKLDAKIDALKESSPKQNFFYYEGGSTIQASAKKATFKDKKSGQSGNFMEVVNIEMEPREDYSNDTEDELVCLDDLIRPACPKALKEKATSKFTDADWKACYQELDRILHQTGGAATEEEEDEDEGDEEEEEEKKPVASSNGKKPAGKPKPVAKDDDDEEEEDEDDEDEGGEDEDEDDEGDDDGDEPVAPAIRSEVSWKNKGKTLTGTVVKTDGKKKLATVKTKDKKEHVVDFADLTAVESEEEEDEDDDDDNDD